ncbi:hypothetical protein GOODEAATRI_032800 [Goodea atripinnis]|uniref:Uncharacterized protein n=1 Tax=Goodea atripinnis TaxID=208336 RepID=A0ABV0P9N5_9TELE
MAGSQNRISQPETPVTLQFQGNKFTLSPSQLRQLTTGQPLQLQGTLGNLKERLRRLFEANEQRCNRRVLYGSDLLQACTLSSEPAHTALTAGGWTWVGRESCIRALRTCVGTTSVLQSSLLTVEDHHEATKSLTKRYFHFS